MRQKILLGWLVLLSVIIPCPLMADTYSAEHTPVHLAVPPWPPFIYPDKRKGLVEEVVSAVFEQAEQPVRISVLPWRRAVWNAQKGSVDGLAAVWYSPERASYLLFSKPYYTNRIIAVYPQAKPPVDLTVRSLMRMRLGLREGGYYGPAVSEAKLPRAVYASKDENLLRMLAVGRLDLALGDALIMRTLLGADPELGEKLEISESPVALLPLHLGLVRDKPGNEQLIGRFNRGLAELQQSGKLAAIIQRYHRAALAVR